MKICGIYIIKAPSGKIYIGQSIDIKRRFKTYKYVGAKQQYYLNNSFEKYGFDNHVFNILFECKREELNSKEVEFINKYNSFNSKIGMNLTNGGCQNWKISEETRERMRNRPKIIHSEETKNKMRLSAIGKNKGKTSPRKGVKLSDETKEKISKNHSHSKPMLGKKHSEEAKSKIRDSKIGKPAYNRRPVIDTNTGIIYSHKKEASDALGIKVRTLKAKLEGKLKNNTSIRYV